MTASSRAILSLSCGSRSSGASARQLSVRLNPLTGLSVHRLLSRFSLYPHRRPPLIVPVREHGQTSGETYVTTLTLQKAFEACQANKSAWLQRRDELKQAEQAYREQLAGNGHKRPEPANAA